MSLVSLNEDQARVFKYIIIGVFCTACTWILWNLIFWALQGAGSFEQTTNFAISQYSSAFIMIYPSFYLNRIMTFSDMKQQDSHEMVVISKAYVVYITAPLTAAILTYLFVRVNLNIFDSGILTIIVQGIALFLGMCINFFGQKLWIYKK